MGEPGAGKSRLTWELVQSLQRKGWLALEGASASHARASLQPITELVRGYFGIDEHTDPADASDRVMQALRQHDSDLIKLAPAMLDLMRVPFTDSAWEQTEPARRRQTLLLAVRKLLLNECRNRPVVLVIEDLHWADSATLEAVELLFEVLPIARLFVIVTYRPEFQSMRFARGSQQLLTLSPLPAASVQSMLGTLLGDDEKLATLRSLIAARADGNPFFLEECVRTVLVREGAGPEVEGDTDGLRTALRDHPRIDVPITVHAVLAARIDDLAPVDRQVLQNAAVIGRVVPIWLLGALTALPLAELEVPLWRLCVAGFLVGNGSGEASEYMFTHALTQDVAYRGLLLEHRQALHGSALDALTRHYGARHIEHAELLAYHAYQGERWVEAVKFLRSAAGWAKARSEYLNASALLKEACLAAAHLPPGVLKIKREIDIRFELRNVLWGRDRLVEGLAVLAEVEPLLEELLVLGDGDPLTRSIDVRSRRARLLAHTTSNYLVIGDNERALELGSEALELARQVDEPELQADTSLFRGVLHTSRGDFRTALEHLERVVRVLADRTLGRSFEDFYTVHAQVWQVWCLAELGRVAEAEVAVARARMTAQVAKHSHNVVAADWAAGFLDRARGRHEAAQQWLAHGEVICRSAGVHLWLRPTAALLGDARVRCGRLADGLALLEASMVDSENNVGLALWRTALAEAYLRAGRIDDAYATGEGAYRLSCKHNEAGFQAHAARGLGRIAAAAGDVREARSRFREALALGDARGMLPLLARCHADLALLDGAASEHARAAESLAARLGLRVSDLD